MPHVSVKAARRSLFLLCILFASFSWSEVYISAGSSFQGRAVFADPPHKKLGVATLSILEGKGVPALVEEKPPAANWWTGVFDGESMKAPIGDGKCRECATRLKEPGQQRLQGLWVARSFQVQGKLPQFLHLRVRARDGYEIYLNGELVARENLGAMWARRRRGSEWHSQSIVVQREMLRPGKNVLAALVRPSANSSRMIFDLELTSAEKTRLVRHPTVWQERSGHAYLLFETDRPVQASVAWEGADGEKGMVQSAGGGFAKRHRVLFKWQGSPVSLKYKVRIPGLESVGGEFAPLPTTAPIRFAVYGDMRGGHRIHQKIVQEIQRLSPDFVLNTGDLVQRGSDEADWQRFFALTNELRGRTVYFPTAGNHDLGRAGTQRLRFNEIFPLPRPAGSPVWASWYSLDIAGAHFVFLDSNAYKEPLQLEWLKKDLSNAKDAKAIFVFVHDGPYSRGLHGGNLYAQRRYAPVLRSANVTLLFSGHDHLYQRGRVDGLSYVVTGGGGAPLYRVRCGVRGKRPCKKRDGMQKVVSAHHYIMVTMTARGVRMCPRKVDGGVLEKCVTYSLRN